MNSNYPSRTADKFVVRLPEGLRDDIHGAADYLDTSMNTVFVQAVRQYLDGQHRQQLLLDALAFAASLGGSVQPAPVALVLPERRDLPPSSPAFYARGWNACLDEVTRLNTK